jgi:hypothetical protein
LNVIEQGYDCVLAEEAFCSENPGKSLESEFRRQSRITNRTLRAIFRNARLLNPLRFPHFAFFLFSHKIARFLVPLFLMMSGAALVILTPRGGIYAAAAPAVFIAVMLSVLSTRLARGTGRPLSRLFRFVNVFLTINVAVLHGWWGFLSGRGDVTWQHDRA